MRDPDLVQRAERAAFALERAWDRWRTMHGFGSDPLPPVSSYVGYSLEEPWGQPRVVFGVDAAEAELLANLLDGHDCVGPVHAELTASSEWRRAAANGMGTAPWPSADQLSIPAQAPQPGSEMLPAAGQADVDADSARPAGIQLEVPEFELEVHHMHANDVAESAASTSPAPDVLEPGSVDGAAASPGAAADNAAGGAAATDGVSADRGQSPSGQSPSGKPGSASSGSASSGGASSGSAQQAGGKSGNGPSASGPSGKGPSGKGPSGKGPSASAASGSPSSAEGAAGSGKSASGPLDEGSSGGGPARSGGRPDPAATTEATDMTGLPQSAASRPKPRKPPAASPARTVVSGHSGAADAPAFGPQAAPPPGQGQQPVQGQQPGQGQPPVPPQPGIVAFRPRPESLRTSQQAEPPAPTASSDNVLPTEAPGHRGPRYQGHPPQYQDGPDPTRALKAYAAAPVADSDVPAPARQPERGKSRQLSRLGRTRRQGPGAHEAWGSDGDQTAADHAV